ncbi:MAG: serine/threonine-protein kinase [Cystobacter sp.]
MQEHSSTSWRGPHGLSLEPGAQVAGFTLEALLATGGSGCVYLARRGEQRVALKLVPHDDWGEREVDALRRVRHSPVVNLLGYGLWPEQRPHFLVLTLELVEGLALDAWARAHNPSARQLVHQVLLPLTRALAQVHAAGVVHRDIKEANVIIRAADGLPVLVDFGSARHEGAERLTERMPPGTREYRSPEMLRFSREWDGGHYPSTPLDDLWALGVTLYLLLTCELPFGDRGGPLVQRILEQALRPVHELNPRVPRALGDVCLRMLEKAPSARYPTPESLAEALTRAMEEADAAWDVPLQPSLPARAEPGRVPPGGPGTTKRGRLGAWPTVLLGSLSLLLWNQTASPPIPRTGLSSPSPSLQAPRRQELANVPPTGEVVSGARPPRSLPSAPVDPTTPRKEPVMSKSPRTRNTLATTAGLAACVGLGCASVPRAAEEPPPPPIDCPEGTVETYRAHHVTDLAVIILSKEGEWKSSTTVHHNAPVRGQLLDPWGDLPQGTPLFGRTWFWKDRVYGRLTELVLPSGERQPICLDLSRNGPGIAMTPGHTRTTTQVHTAVGGTPVLPKQLQRMRW